MITKIFSARLLLFVAVSIQLLFVVPLFFQCEPVNPQPEPINREMVFGVNTNHYQDKEKQALTQSVRLYLPIGWVWTQNGFRGQPMKQGQKQFIGIDDYLYFMKAKGVEVIFDLMESPDWLNGKINGFGLNTNDWPPIRPGLDKSNPYSYAEVAMIYKGFAIRYGSKVWPAGSYPIDQTPIRWTGDGPQKYESGLNLIKYIEVGNELDRWWSMEKYMNPVEHVAFLSKCYDAIKEADPTMKVVMAGLTGYDVKYLHQMKAASDALGRKFPADVINVHHYSSTGNLPGVHPPNWPINSACPPEIDKNMATLKQVVSFADSLGLPTWVTEHGYDTTPGSQLAPETFGGAQTGQLQSDWNVRACLEHIRLGAARSYVFNIADEPGAAGSLFQSSGLLHDESTGYAEKVSFRSFINLSSTLRGFKYVGDQSTESTRIIKFSDASGRIVHAFWSPTASGKTYGSIIAGQNSNVTEFVQFTNISQ